MIRYRNGSRRVEYVCRGYQRNGKGYCSSHRIHEEVLDKAVWDDTEKLREQYAAELKKVTQLQKQWALRKPVLDAHCLTLQKEILRLEQEIDELVMEKLNGDGGSRNRYLNTVNQSPQKQNRGPASAATILNEERPLPSRRARPARLPDIQRSFLSGAPDRT